MSAKATDLARIQAIMDIVSETERQVSELEFTKERFSEPETVSDQLIAEALMNRVFRATEEAGALSDEVLAHFEFERSEIKGVRNRLAHAYGDVDDEIIWEVIQEDFPKLLEGCKAYCDEMGIEVDQ